MSHDPHAQIDHTVLDMIEHSPTGAVPHTPTYQDALRRLRATHQIYTHADHKDGYVTVRSLSHQPHFHATNLDGLLTGESAIETIEANSTIYDRYVQSLPENLRARAEALRPKVAGKALHHRAKLNASGEKVFVHDPLHTLFLVPGAGPHPGIPGNYLYGYLVQHGEELKHSTWTLAIHDADDGIATVDVSDLNAALAKLQEVMASAPFHLLELAALEFRSNY